MKSRLILPVLLSAVASVAGAQASVQADTGRTVIAASGQARQVTVPDRATLFFMIEPQAMSVDEAASRLPVVEKAVLDTLRRLNLAPNAIQSFNSGIAPYRNNMNPSMSGPSFAGRSMIRVEVSRLDQIPAITAAALAKGASFISSPAFAYSGADSLRRALLPQAFQMAQREAETLARAAGGRLGRLIDVSTTTSPNFFNEGNQQMFISTMGYDNGQRMTPSATVLVSVATRWVLIPNR
jgi:uncharacterized protein YggE